VLRRRTRAALAAARERGLHVIVVTGRMFQAVRRYLTGPEPVVCYQGAVVADPETGKFLRHVPIPLELAREGIEATETDGVLFARETTSERVGEVAAANGIVLHELVNEASSLEEVFLELTADREIV